jgi:hypothetical protein
MQVIGKEFDMSNKSKWLVGIGILLGLLILFAIPFIWQALWPGTGFGMMGYRTMPMMRGFPMHGSYGFGGFSFMMFFLWLIPPGLLALIVLGIFALTKYLRNRPA